MNFCNWIPKADNGIGKLFFGSIILSQHDDENFRYREVQGFVHMLLVSSC